MLRQVGGTRTDADVLRVLLLRRIHPLAGDGAIVVVEAVVDVRVRTEGAGELGGLLLGDGQVHRDGSRLAQDRALAGIYAKREKLRSATSEDLLTTAE